jgi:hypothetical protein
VTENNSAEDFLNVTVTVQVTSGALNHYLWQCIVTLSITVLILNTFSTI